MKNAADPILLALAVCLFLYPPISLCGENKPSCAVLTFRTDEGIHSGQAGLVSAHFAVLLQKAGQFNVLSRYQMNRILLANNFDQASHLTDSSLALAAGKLLGVDRTISGSVIKSSRGYILSTSLYNVHTGKRLARAVTMHNGDLSDFMDKAESRNLKILLNLPEKSRKPGVVPGPKPSSISKEKQPHPVPKPLRPPEKERAAEATRKSVPLNIPDKEPAERPVSVNRETAHEEKEAPVEDPAQKKTADTPRRTRLYSIFEETKWKELLSGCLRNTRHALHDRMEIGWRFTHFWLVTEHDDFIGSIDTIKAEQCHIFDELFMDDYWLNGLYGNWLFDEQWALELTYNAVHASTWSHGNHHTDGTLEVSGPGIALVKRWPNAVEYKPYAGLGLTWFMSTHVTTDNPWHHGFGGSDIEAYNEWVESGAPAYPNNGYQRSFNLDKAVGIVFCIGAEKSVRKNLSADINLRYTNVTFDNTYNLSFYGDVKSARTSEFDLSNLALSLGIKCLL